MIVPGIVSALVLVSLAAPGASAAPPDAAIPSSSGLVGVDVSDVPPAYPHRYGASGAYVVRVAPDSPAEAARLLPGDVIVRIGGVAISDHAGFRAATAGLAAGTPVPIAVERYGRAVTLDVTPVAPAALYPKAPSCEPDATVAELDAAAVSARRHDFDNERVHGARALDDAERCAWLQQKPLASTLMNAGDAMAAIGTAAADQSQRDFAECYLGNAWVIYRFIATTPGLTSADRRDATAKASSLERRVPLVSTRSDGAIVDGLAYAGSSLGTNAFTVVNAWNTSGDNYTRLLHVRVRIDTARDALVFANFFRVSVSSDDGNEVYFAIDSASRPGPRIAIPGRAGKAEIAPDEDLGVLGHAFVVAQTPATYVVTFVIGDRHADLTNTASTLAYLPQ